MSNQIPARLCPNPDSYHNEVTPPLYCGSTCDDCEYALPDTRAEIVAKMRRCAERMLAHVADMEAGKTGQGLAYFDPDTYRDALIELAKIDHTNGY